MEPQRNVPREAGNSSLQSIKCLWLGPVPSLSFSIEKKNRPDSQAAKDTPLNDLPSFADVKVTKLHRDPATMELP